MKKPVMLFVIIMMMFSCASIALAADTPHSIFESVKKESDKFDPDVVGDHIEAKANEIFGISKAGSKFYIAIAISVFFILLVAGLFSKKALKLAFVVLLISFVGYIFLNYWIQIKDGIMSFIKWLFTKGS